jgi:hypothetical protein
MRCEIQTIAVYHTAVLLFGRYSESLAFTTCSHTIQHYTACNVVQLQITHKALAQLYSRYKNHIHLTRTVFVFLNPILKTNCSHCSSFAP